MARAFKSTLRGYAGYLETAERQILRTLFADVIQMLGGVVPTAEEKPEKTSLFSRRPKAPKNPMESIDLPETKTSVDDAFWDLVGSLPEDDETVVNREDPAIARLLPAAGSGESAEQISQDFQGLAEDSVRTGHIDDLQRSMALLQSANVVLSFHDAPAFARALNAVRLVLATRLGIDDEETAEEIAHIGDVSDAEDVESYMALLYNFVSWLQESLMTAMIGDLP